MSDTLVNQVEAFYKFRYNGDIPTHKQDLFWLLSEVGELAEAWVYEMQDVGMSDDELKVLSSMISLGKMAEGVVATQRTWIRNNDRVKLPKLRYEIADVLMMLTRLSIDTKNGSPQFCLSDKMATKNFIYTGDK